MSQLSQTLRQFVTHNKNFQTRTLPAMCQCRHGHLQKQIKIQNQGKGGPALQLVYGSQSSHIFQSTLPPVSTPCHVDVPLMAMTNVNNRYGFDNMIDIYRNSGGTARADDLALLLEERQKGDFVSLAKRLVSRDIFSFKFRNHFWIPMFQFDARDMSVKKEVRRVVNELQTVLDSWTLALWFTEPNAWLNEERPVDQIARRYPDVLAAARADRFVAAG